MRIEKVRDRERRNKKKSIGRKINQHEIGHHNYYYYFCSLCPTRRPRMMTTDDGKLFFVLQYADNTSPGQSPSDSISAARPIRKVFRGELITRKKGTYNVQGAIHTKEVVCQSMIQASIQTELDMKNPDYN
jgi:hypothetical protein